MMAKRSIFAAIAAASLAAVSAFAAVKPGENLLVNGTLEAEQMDFPPFWESYGQWSRDSFTWHRSGGPDGLPYFSVDASKVPDVRLKQFGLDLVANGRYRISMQVRTKDFRSGSHTGVMLVNSGMWKSTAGILSLPADTAGEWRRVSEEFNCFAAPDGYVAMVHVTNQKGALDIADIRLEAIDELALRESGQSKVVACEKWPRLVPLSPLLSKIPADDPAITIRLFGELEKADGEYEVFAAVDGGGRSSSAIVRDGKEPATVRLPVPAGATNGQMTVGVVCKATGKTVTERRYNFRVVPAPDRKAAAKRHRLNNLSAEVLAATLAAEATNRLEFVLSRDGWTYVAVKGSPREDFAVRIDGQDVIWRDTPRLETFRRLKAGTHVMAISGAGPGSVVVREIAEILNYCPGFNSAVKENPPYDWDFNERYVLPAVTTQLGGNVPKEHVGEFRKRGFVWVQNINLTGAEADVMVDTLSKCRGLTSQDMSGVACDEQNLADVASIDAYANGIWTFDLEKRPARPVYTWAYGKANRGAVIFDFMSACVNVAGGTGKLVRERYVATRETEEEARQYLRNDIGATFEDYRNMMPDAMGSFGLVYGNFNQVPILSIAHHPEVDYKYALDMQMNFAANDPVFRDLGLVGYWGSYYADEEMHRWSFALMRHYVVEGNTNMLSEAYGFSYRPDHLIDGDFRKGLASWRTSGTVRADSHASFALRSQNRWGSSGGVGDTFAVLVRGDGDLSAVSQTIKGLVPGRKYCLQFATFDVKDVKANRIAPRRFGIDATLSDGAEIDGSLSWVHVDKRIKGRYEANNGVARINLHHTVFTARAEEVELTIGNSAASPGEELGVNFVSVKPYYAR